MIKKKKASPNQLSLDLFGNTAYEKLFMVSNANPGIELQTKNIQGQQLCFFGPFQYVCRQLQPLGRCTCTPVCHMGKSE